MTFNTFERLLRKFMKILIGLLFLFLGILLAYYSKTNQDNLNQALNTNVDCLNTNFTDSDIIAEKSFAVSLRVKTSCFCINSFNSIGIASSSLVTISDNSTPCSTYVSQYNSTSTILIIICIPLLNLASRILKCKFCTNRSDYQI